MPAKKSVGKKVASKAEAQAPVNAPKFVPPSQRASVGTKTVTKFIPLPAGYKAPPLAKLTSWSYSVYTQYLKCPLSVCFDKVKRIKIEEPPNPAFIKGNKQHTNVAQAIGHPSPVDLLPELAVVADRVALYRKLKAKVEQDWAFTRQWLPTTWNDWTSCWLRIKTDVCAVTPPKKKTEPTLIQITDWKSGKIYDDHRQQRSLYALGGLQLVELGVLPGSKDVKLVAEHLYTDLNQSATEEFTMDDLKPLKSEWERRVKDMMNDTVYPAKPGYHCGWCKFRKSAGGPCPEDR